MPAVTEKLRDAQALAEFSNLRTDRVEYFRNNYPEFVPQGWWDLGEVQWRAAQLLVRNAWENRFGGGLASIVRLLLFVFDPSRLRKSSEPVVDKSMTFEAAYMLVPAALPLEFAPFQRAVLYLFENPWRARFCAECKVRFVAAEPKNKFCSEACSHENRNRQKREWFRKNGKQWRRKRRAKLT